MTRRRDVEERMGQRTSLMVSRVGSVECRLKNLEVKMDEHHGEIMAMFQKFTIGSTNYLQGKVSDEVVIRGDFKIRPQIRAFSQERYRSSSNQTAKESICLGKWR